MRQRSEYIPGSGQGRDCLHLYQDNILHQHIHKKLPHDDTIVNHIDWVLLNYLYPVYFHLEGMSFLIDFLYKSNAESIADFMSTTYNPLGTLSNCGFAKESWFI